MSHESDSLSARAEECEQIALFLYRLGDTAKADERMQEAAELRSQITTHDPNPNYDAPKPLTTIENWQRNDEHHQP